MTSLRGRPVVFCGTFALGVLLIASSRPRRIGDGAEYVAMAVNLAHGERPSLTPAQLATARMFFSSDPVDLASSGFVGGDGRQDFPHFWFYSLLAAPFVRLALALDVSPLRAFAVLNLTLWSLAAAILSTRVRWPAAVLVVLSPIVWWLDKAHTEVFTLSLVAIAVSCLERAPWWSAIAFGAAAAQNPPWLMGWALAVALGARRNGARHARLWMAAALGGLFAVLHPLYYQLRLGDWSGLLRGYVDRHVPTATREITTVLIDPNVGLLVHDPVLVLAAALGVLVLMTRRRITLPGLIVAATAATCLISFSQTTNFNGGGTPNPSHYSIWLIPLCLPLLDLAASALPRVVVVLASAGAIWCVTLFLPATPEHYLTPTPVAAAIWRWWPALDNPLAEVFAKRVSGSERTFPGLPLATADCGKVLIAGGGGGADWPARCGTAAIPARCQPREHLCYANRTRDGYAFDDAPSAPAWRRQLARLASPGPSWSAPLADGSAGALTAWLVDGWSYSEGTGTSAYRWIGDQARVGLRVDQNADVVATLDARAFSRSRRLRVSVDGQTVGEATITVRTATVPLTIGHLALGSHQLRFESLDGSDRVGAGDPRRLSVAISRLMLGLRTESR